MSGSERFTIEEGHRRFAVDLFNYAWDLLEKEDRTAEEDEQMVHAAHASRFHWGKAGAPRNLAVGEWQIARVYAALRRPEPALHHAKRALEIIEENGITGFNRASAYEGLARAYSVAGDKAETLAYIERAKAESELVADKEEREVLFSQLAEIPEYRE